MSARRSLLGLGLLLSAASMMPAPAEAGEKAGLGLSASQEEFLRLEPILVTVKVVGDAPKGLPAVVGGESAAERFGFEIEPAVTLRKGAKPLPGEAGVASALARKFDLLEWYEFPASGTFTVRAVSERDGTRVLSEPIRVTIHDPGKGDPEFDAVARLHHIPWSNYDTNAYCGDTADVVKNWPKSRLAKYCHYWNGRYAQNQKDYDKAVASYEALIAGYPGFPLANDARRGIEECKAARAKK